MRIQTLWLRTLLLMIIFTFFYSIKAEAFKVGDLEYPSSSIVTPYKDKATEEEVEGYLTNYYKYDYPPITVTPKTPGNIIKSVKLLRKTGGTEYSKLTNIGGDQWKINTIIGSKKTAIKEATPYSGYFEWFRDPNKYVWMYDIPGQERVHYRTKQIAEYPISGMMRVPDPFVTSGPEDAESHISEIHHDTSLGISFLDLEEDNRVSIPVEKASNVHVNDNEIRYETSHINDSKVIPHLIRKDDIVNAEADYVDVANNSFKFHVKAHFNNDRGQVISDTPTGGLVTRWYDGWKFVFRGEVYFVPELYIEAEEGPPPDQPDLTVESIVMNGCPEVGTEALFTYTIWNKDAATTKDFKVQIRVDGTEIATHTFTGGLGANTKKTGTVRYTFPAAGEKTFSVFVDSNNDILESDEPSSSNNVLLQTFKPCDPDEPPPKPPDLKITGDFTFSRPSIYFGENNNVFPVGITVTGGNGCTYVSHNFTFSQGSKFFAPRDNLSPKDKSYLYQYDSGFKEYGGGIKTGTVSVKMKINTSCGITEEVGPKTFEIVTDPSHHPPYLEIAWYINGVEISDSVPEGTVVELRVKKETDADNDLDTREWFFDESTSWVSGLPAKYGWSKPYDEKGYYYITASTQGFHKVCAQSEDLRGNVSNKTCAFLDVIGPNPIPVISGATSVKVNRPLTPTLDSLKSYSPVPGRTINHARDEWSSSAVWSDGTTSSWGGYSNSFTKEGKVTVSLHVFDSIGLKSVAPDTHVITVLPDDPPVIEFEYLSVMTRSAQTFRNASYSPDGDGIETYRVTVGYEWSNNGVFNIYESEISTNNSGFTFHPTRVGKYHFRVYAKEPQVYGKDAYKDYVVEVINDNPEVTFTVTGEATEPNPINVAGLNPNDLMWWTNTSLDKWSMTNSWVVGPDGSLVSGKRIPGTTSFFSVPIGDANIKLQGKQLQLGGTNIPLDRTGFTPIGNEAFIGLNSSNYMYVVSPNFAPKSLGEKVYTANMYVNYATDELMVLNIQTGTSSIYIEKWTKYRLSDLRNGNVVVASSGTREVRYFSGGQYYTETGQVGTWSDGTRPGNYSRVRFRDDYKEVNLTTRTVKSYYPWDLINPYKTESYNTIPSFKGLRFSNQTTLTWYPNEYPDAILAPTSDGRNYSNVSMDAKGNYYMYVRESWDSFIVKIDGFTGIPISTSKINHDFFGQDTRLTSISEDGNIAELYSAQTYYFDLRTGNQTGAAPKFMSNFNSNSYQNGYGFKTIDEPTTYWDDDCGCWLPTTTRVDRLHELSNNQRVWDNTVGVGTIVSENQYIEGGYLYRYNPSENQPAASNEPFTFGQLINTSSQQITNGTILWSMKTRLDQVNMTAGMGFRIQNYLNMYRLESNKSKLNLVKIVNGRKIVISSVNRTAAADTWVPYRIKINGSNMKVYENNSLIMDEWDDTFTWGTMGPFSTADSSQFKGMSFQWSNSDSSYSTPGTAIVDTNVKYDPTYNDQPENDPRLDIRTQWSYQHVDTTKFLDYGDGKTGLSSLHGRTITSPSLTFDKVGVYKIDYRVPDDPHQDHRIANGDLMFEGYSKYSDWYTQYLIVHRRPISLFNIWQDGNRMVLWSDSSYDPDHCYNSGNCQNQSDYPTSHGIYKKKFYYITPSGNRVDGKLIRPTESGTYVVAMAVADEYNAWSDWYEVTIDICNGCQAAPNNPPGVYLTFPSGTQDNPSPVSLRPTIYWNQWDPDPGTVYETFDLNIKEEWGACVECVTNKFMGTTAGNWAWTMDVQLTQGRKYSAQVRINDGETWSAWSNVGWMVTNSPPAAYMSYPWGSQDNPTIVNTRRPTLTWTQSDPDAGAWLDYYQILIINEANNYTIYDSGKVWQHTQSNSGNLVVPVDLPTGQKMRVKVKVWDQFGAESNWSPDVWMMINRPPIAQFTWKVNPPSTLLEGPAWEGDHIQIINQSSDPDNDPISSAWSIKDPSGNVSTYTTDPYLTFVQPGNYEVTLTVTDQQGASDTLTRIIPVSTMVLLGFVNHTDEWNKNRIQYNQSKTNTDDKPRGYEVFFPGEIFLLKADTTGNVIKTESQILGTSFHTNMTKISGADFNGVWTGSIWDESMINWDNQTITFRFTSTTPTGYKKTTDVQIIIDDDEYWRQKRSR
ncbi:CARDB domain-containing protein [Paenibacillus sp. NPDC056579]|uniref:CARDB domain-containing protein n=1 Tax=Paenibacillus sp. NPDC056579 TaxID=3345871 RepID=UPI0036B36CE8